MDEDLKISQLMQMQRALYELHKDRWSPMEPQYGREFLLYMVEEMGEVISILKKKGNGAVLTEPAVRAAFLEEMSDVLMYYVDTLLRFGVTPEELSSAYVKKHLHNTGRNYEEEYSHLFPKDERSIMFQYIFFDLDDTILDFHKAEAIAIGKTFRASGLPDTPEMISHYSEVNKRQWELLNQGKLTRDQVLTTRFEILFQECGLTADVPAVLDRYEHYLAIGHYFMPGAEEVLACLAPKYDLYIASNGTGSVQDGRLKSAGILPLFRDVFISERLGANKPSKDFFDLAFARIPGFNREKALMIGDSLTSDILGGINAGIATCWYNPKGLPPREDIRPDYEIRALTQLRDIL